MNPEIRAKQKASEYGLSIMTGGSSGIGKSIIEQVSKLRPDTRVCNISRRKPTSFLIDSTHTHLETDLTNREQRSATIEKITLIIRNLPASCKILLINNAGYGFYGSIEDHSSEEHLRLVELNTLAILDLTTRLLPEIKQRGGGIMNIASTTAFQPTPWMATYGASKAFLLNWSLALREELRGTGVNCLAVCPGPTRTHFHENAGFETTAREGSFGMSPDQVAAESLKALEKGRSLHIPGFGNRLTAFFATHLPRQLAARLAGLAIRRYRPPSS